MVNAEPKVAFESAYSMYIRTNNFCLAKYGLLTSFTKKFHNVNLHLNICQCRGVVWYPANI